MSATATEREKYMYFDNIYNYRNNHIIFMKNISPLRYPGGKTRACKKLEIIINKYFNLKIM